MLHTTFHLLKRAGACGQKPGSGQGYDKLAQALGGTTAYGKGTPIPLDQILETNGLDDTLWCLRAVMPEERQVVKKRARLLACDYAEHVLPLWEAKYPDNQRPRKTIETARRYAHGQATREEVAAAYAAAYAAAAYAADAYTADAAYAAADAAYAAAAYAAAADAADAYTADAARIAEREWQAQRFLEMLRDHRPD